MKEAPTIFTIPTYRLRDVAETIEIYDDHFWSNGHTVKMMVFDDSILQEKVVSNEVQLQFLAADSLRAYQIETTTLLLPAQWVSFGSPVQGDGTLKSFALPKTNSSSGFYRLRIY